MTKRKSFRISDQEDQILKKYCQEMEKTENQVVRGLIAALAKKEGDYQATSS